MFVSVVPDNNSISRFWNNFFKIRGILCWPRWMNVSRKTAKQLLFVETFQNRAKTELLFWLQELKLTRRTKQRWGANVCTRNKVQNKLTILKFLTEYPVFVKIENSDNNLKIDLMCCNLKGSLSEPSRVWLEVSPPCMQVCLLWSSWRGKEARLKWSQIKMRGEQLWFVFFLGGGGSMKL